MLPIAAAIQMCSSNLIDDNLNQAEKFFAESAKNNAKLVILPEMFALMGDDITRFKARESFGHGKIQSFLSHQAQKNKIWIVGGTIPIASIEKDKIKAASLVFNDEGVCVARYDKIHLFDVTLSEKETYSESANTTPGNQLCVVKTPFGKIGLAVCYDLRFPELFRSLFNKGAEIIILPSAFTQKTGLAHWEVLARSRAIENFCYFIGSCQGGVHTNGRKTYGNSLIIDPWGTILAKKEGIESGVIYAPIALDKVYEIRKSIPIDKHQRIFFDTSKLD